MSEIFVDGLVTVKQGDTILLDNVHNKFVDNGLKGIISLLAVQFLGRNGGNGYMAAANAAWNIYLGTNTTTVTVPTMTALIAPIGTAPGTVATTKSLSVKDGTSDGIWNTIYTASWTAGTVTGTVGEMALYLNWPSATTFRWTGDPSSTIVWSMGSRLSVADSEFTSFTIDNTKPLTIDWKIQFSF